MSTINPPRFLDTKSAAEYIGVSPRTLEDWRRERRQQIRYVRVGAKVRYFISDLEAWLQSRAVEPEPVTA